MTDSVADPVTDSSTERTPLAHALQAIDTKYDSRDCPHNCSGTLSVDDNDRVLCESCRCTPDGVYLPPTDESATMEGRFSQFVWFYPKGQRPEDGVVEQWEHDRYPGSDRQCQLPRVRMAGGYEAVYDETLPAGEGDEYEYDLSTY